MAKIRLILFVGVGMIFIMGCQGQYNEKKMDISSDDILNKEVNVKNVFIGYYGWPRKFEEICKAYNIPCGLEESPEDPMSDAKEEVFDFGSQQATIHQFMDKIIEKHPAYYWGFGSGVLNIIPRDGKDYQINNNSLSRKTKKIYVQNKTPELAVQFICLKNNIIQPGKPNWNPGFRKLIKNKNLPPKLNLKIQDMSVREALNEIVKFDPRIGFWRFYFDNRKNIEEYRIEYESWGE